MECPNCEIEMEKRYLGRGPYTFGFIYECPLCHHEVNEDDIREQEQERRAEAKREMR